MLDYVKCDLCTKFSITFLILLDKTIPLWGAIKSNTTKNKSTLYYKKHYHKPPSFSLAAVAKLGDVFLRLWMCIFLVLGCRNLSENVRQNYLHKECTKLDLHIVTEHIISFNSLDVYSFACPTHKVKVI